MATTTRKPLHSLPDLPRRPRGPLIGRDDAIREVMERLSGAGPDWVVAIEGMAGLGKTALALEVASRFIAEYDGSPPQGRFEAIIWAAAGRESAAGTDREGALPTSLDDVFRAIAQTLDIPTLLQAAPAERLKKCWAALERAERTLLVVDNLEEDESNQVLAFLRDLPRSTKALVTTRFRDGIPAHLCLRLAPLDEAATRELVRRAFGARGMSLTKPHAEAMASAAHGSPLAVHLIAGLAYQEGIEAALRRVSDAQAHVSGDVLVRLVARLERERPPAFHTLLACAFFDWQVGASADALEAVVGLAPDETRRALGRLGDLNLISEAGGRYTLLPLTHEYATSELGHHAGWEQHARDRWVTYYRRLAANLDDTATHERLRVERDNLALALTWLAGRARVDALAEMFRAAQQFLYGEGRWDELLLAADVLLDHVERADRRGSREAGLLTAVVQTPIDIYRRRGDLERGSQLVLRARRCARAARDELLDAEISLATKRLLCNDGTLNPTQSLPTLLGQPRAEAAAYLQSLEPEFTRDVEGAVRVFANRARSDKVVQAYETLGNYYRARKAWQRARECYERALETLEAAPGLPPARRAARGSVLRANRGLIMGRLGDLDAACAALSREHLLLPDRVDRAEALAAWAYYELRRGDRARASSLREEADKLKRWLQVEEVYLCWEDRQWCETA